MGANQSCVASGANPHSMGVRLINHSSKNFTLSQHADHTCQCGDHRGFSAEHGKFRPDYTPPPTIRSSHAARMWMSGRSGSAVCPAGWIAYDIEGGGVLQIIYNSAGWTDLQNRAFVLVHVTNCSSLTITIVEKDISRHFGSEFEGTDLHRQFEITVEDCDPRTINNRQSSCAGLAAENRVLSFVTLVIPGGGLFVAAYHGIQGNAKEAREAAIQGGIGLAGGVIAGPLGAILAQNIGGRAVANVHLNISGPEDMEGCHRITELNTVPHFPTFLARANLRRALDRNLGGQVVTGGACAGVAIQRTWYLLTGDLPEHSIWKNPKAPCIGDHFRIWLEQDGLEASCLSSWRAVVSALEEGQVVNCIIRNLHWVTLIGVDHGLVYCINYPGLYAVPEIEFEKHVQNIAMFAPTAAVAARVRLR